MFSIPGLLRTAISSGRKPNLFHKFARALTTSTNKYDIAPWINVSASTINNHWIYQHNEKIELPILKYSDIRLPVRGDLISQIDPVEEIQPIIAPGDGDTNDSKEAVTMIVVRRKKMKKHKLRKLRKKMKYEWAKARQRRELRKEKVFQAELLQQCKEGEAFSAEQYVQERIDKLNEIIIPRYWKGKRLPEFIIREKMGLSPKS